jgi:carboxyl-terminal processing protease
MTQGAIEGMIASLGDFGHTTYLTAEQLRQLETGLKGKLEGIGARMTIRQRQPTVVQTMPGSPARKAGLRAGDILLEVNGKSVSGLPLEQVASQVRGPAGTTVRLHLMRGPKGKILDLRITRAKVEVPAVTWHLLPGVPIAHVAIQEFGSQADSQLRTALREARAQGAKGLILDVRGNPGGLKDQAVWVTSEFLKQGTVFIRRDARGHEQPVAVRAGGQATDIPLCVLIDEGTASSAEILAGALQDYQRGKVIGTKTFGTGTVLQPFPLSDGSAVLLAVAEWLTPKGRQIWHKGITPDIEVKLPKEAAILLPETESDLSAAGLARTEDKQLLKGLEVLREQLGAELKPADNQKTQQAGKGGKP